MIGREPALTKVVLKFRLVTTALLSLGVICATQAQRRAIPASVYGTWKINRFEDLGGHAFEKPELAQKEIGRKIRFDRTAVTFDKNFLFFGASCPRVSYRFEVQSIGEYDVEEKGTLEFYELKPAKSGRVQNVVVRCNGRPKYYFELAAGNELAIYYDGWFFFLEQITK